MTWRRMDLWLRCQLARLRRERSVGINDHTGVMIRTADLKCGCHWHPTYGPVGMVGCERHD